MVLLNLSNQSKSIKLNEVMYHMSFILVKTSHLKYKYSPCWSTKYTNIHIQICVKKRQHIETYGRNLTRFRYVYVPLVEKKTCNLILLYLNNNLVTFTFTSLCILNIICKI